MEGGWLYIYARLCNIQRRCLVGLLVAQISCSDSWLRFVDQIRLSDSLLGFVAQIRFSDLLLGFVAHTCCSDST